MCIPSARSTAPHERPGHDAELVEASDDLSRLDRAIEALLTGEDDRDADTVPGYAELEEARSTALDRLASGQAGSLRGLLAKARALLTPALIDQWEPHSDLAQSLARDVLDLPREAEVAEPALDLSGCSAPQLARLHEQFACLWRHATAATNAPCFQEGGHAGAAGAILDAEADRLGDILDAIADAASRRAPADGPARDELLSVRVQQDLIRAGRIEDRALLSDIAHAWGA